MELTPLTLIRDRIIVFREIARSQQIVEPAPGRGRAEEEPTRRGAAQHAMQHEVTRGRRPVPGPEPDEQSQVVAMGQRAAPPVIERDRRFERPEVMPATARNEHHLAGLDHGCVHPGMAEAWESREWGTIGELRVPFISRDMLKRNKLAIGRPQDLADLEHL